MDALEFMFSKDGTLERLGQRAINNQAGLVALAHNLAEEATIAPEVMIRIISGKVVTSGSRPATGAKRPIPPIAFAMNACFVVTPIIRGHALRNFVEVHTPEQRYTDIANWLQLGPLVEVQKNIRALRTQVKTAAEDESPLRWVDSQIARETGQAVKAWDDTAVLAYVNTSVLAPLDATLVLGALAVGDPIYVLLEARAKAEENKIGLAGLRQVCNAAVALWAETQDAESGAVFVTGAAPTFEATVEALSAAETKETEERGKAANTVFQALWNAAEPLFAEGIPNPEVCPVCATPIADTAAGSAAAIREHLAKHLDKLGDYAAAKKALDDTRASANKSHTQLVAALSSLIGLLGDEDAALKSELVAYRTGLTGWPQGALPASAHIAARLVELAAVLNLAIVEIESKQGDHTYIKAKAKIDRLLDLQAERQLTRRTGKELGKLSEALTVQSAIISAEIRKKVQALLDKLQTPMNEIYTLIQGAGATRIRLELPAEDDTNQQRLNLLIDFAKNRPGVQQAGYLSD